jgi:hypothetical protein
MTEYNEAQTLFRERSKGRIRRQLEISEYPGSVASRTSAREQQTRNSICFYRYHNSLDLHGSLFLESPKPLFIYSLEKILSGL